MPRKFFRRWVPAPQKLAGRRSLRFLGPLLRDPNLFHLNRHSVSIAFFVGIFTAFMPIPGQTLVAAFLALLLRANLPLSVALIWITNPLTITPIFYSTYELGVWLLDSPPVNFRIELSLDWFGEQGRTILAPLFLGSLLTGLVLGGIGALTIHELWRWSLIRSWRARKRRRRQR